MPFVGSRLLIPLRTVANATKRTYMTGPGSRATQNNKPSGMDLKTMKTHYSLIPLWGVMTVAMSVVVLYVGRLAMKTTDVNWSKNHETWNYYSDKEFKLITTSEGGRKSQAPDYRS